MQEWIWIICLEIRIGIAQVTDIGNRSFLIYR